MRLYNVSKWGYIMLSKIGNGWRWGHAMASR